MTLRSLTRIHKEQLHSVDVEFELVERLLLYFLHVECPVSERLHLEVRFLARHGETAEIQQQHTTVSATYMDAGVTTLYSWSWAMK